MHGQAAWRLGRLYRKAPDEATIEVQMYFEELIAKHKKFRLFCEIADNMSLEPAQDKLLASSRKLETACEEIDDIKAAQGKLLDRFDQLSGDS